MNHLGLWLLHLHLRDSHKKHTIVHVSLNLIFLWNLPRKLSMRCHLLLFFFSSSTSPTLFILSPLIRSTSTLHLWSLSNLLGCLVRTGHLLTMDNNGSKVSSPRSWEMRDILLVVVLNEHKRKKKMLCYAWELWKTRG